MRLPREAGSGNVTEAGHSIRLRRSQAHGREPCLGLYSLLALRASCSFQYLFGDNTELAAVAPFPEREAGSSDSFAALEMEIHFAGICTCYLY